MVGGLEYGRCDDYGSPESMAFDCVYIVGCSLPLKFGRRCN